MATQYPLDHEAFVWALSAFCQLNRIPFSAEFLVKQYPPPYTSTQLEQALQSFGFDTSIKTNKISNLNNASLPACMVLRLLGSCWQVAWSRYYLIYHFVFLFPAIMFWYSWQLALIAVTCLTLITILSFFVTPIIRAKLNHQFMLGARNQAFLTEYVSGMETVKSLQMEPQLKQTFGNYLSTYLNASFDSRKLSITYNTAANTLDQLQTLAILCVGAWLVMHNTNFTIGMLVAFQMFSGRLSGPVLRLVGLWQEFQQAAFLIINPAVKRLGDVMNAPPEPMTLIPTRANINQATNITVYTLGFKYADDLPWLYQNLSFNIQAGHCVLVMGPSGCGKSTLAKLLLGFYQPQQGSIKLNGQDIRYLAANELRNHFGVKLIIEKLSQETVIFSGTIYDNLILANPHASFEQIIQACQLAEIHNTIEKLQQGYQTTVGEHGTVLV